MREPLSTTLKIRVTESLAQRLNSAAEAAGLPLSEYVRRILRSGSDNKEGLELMREAAAQLTVLKEINSCVAELVLLNRNQTMQNYITAIHERLEILGYSPFLKDM